MNGVQIAGQQVGEVAAARQHIEDDRDLFGRQDAVGAARQMGREKPQRRAVAGHLDLEHRLGQARQAVVRAAGDREPGEPGDVEIAVGLREDQPHPDHARQDDRVEPPVCLQNRHRVRRLRADHPRDRPQPPLAPIQDVVAQDFDVRPRS